MKKIICIVLAAVLVMALAAGIYLIPHKCVDETALESTDTVTVSDDGNTCFLDGEGEEALLIFYPGGKVEYTAYCALLKEIAERGVDCCVVRVPLNLAVLDVKKAKSIIEDSPYEKIYVGGHSFGGVAAAMYASDHYDELAGIVFLASYPNNDISDLPLRVLSVKGDRDGLVTAGKMEKAEPLMPEECEYLVIEGGNHAQFGTYGEQSGDNPALISAESQRQQAADVIADFILK